MVDDEEDGLEEDEPEDMEQKKKMGDGNELSAVEKHIKVISTTLKARTKEEGDHAKERVGQYMTQLTQEENIDDERELMKREKKFMAEATKIDATQCLFNPKSFTQTVENIFHFSFAVKSGKAEIKTRGLKEAEEYGLEPGPVLMAKDKGDVEIPNPKQAIVALNMKVSFFPPHLPTFLFEVDYTHLLTFVSLPSSLFIYFSRTGGTCVLPIQWKKVTSLTESRESLQRRRHANPNLTKRIAWVLFIEMRESPSLAAPTLYNMCSVEIVFHSNHCDFLIYVLSKKSKSSQNKV